MSFLDLYFDKTNGKFYNEHIKNNNNVVLLKEDDSFIQI
jgi:hypothetical protein